MITHTFNSVTEHLHWETMRPQLPKVDALPASLRVPWALRGPAEPGDWVGLSRNRD